MGCKRLTVQYYLAETGHTVFKWRIRSEVSFISHHFSCTKLLVDMVPFVWIIVRLFLFHFHNLMEILMSSLEIGTVQITGYDFQGSIIFSHINCYNNYDYAFFFLSRIWGLCLIMGLDFRIPVEFLSMDGVLMKQFLNFNQVNSHIPYYGNYIYLFKNFKIVYYSRLFYLRMLVLII